MPHMAVTGAGPAIQAILSGVVQAGCTALPAAHAQIQSGALVGLGLTAEKRWHDLPNVPTMKEAGFDDFVLDTKIILLAPAKTPKEIVERLAGQLNDYLRRPATRASAQKIGFEVIAWRTGRSQRGNSKGGADVEVCRDAGWRWCRSTAVTPAASRI